MRKPKKLYTVNEYCEANPEISLALHLRLDRNLFLEDDENGVRSVFKGWNR